CSGSYPLAGGGDAAGGEGLGWARPAGRSPRKEDQERRPKGGGPREEPIKEPAKEPFKEGGGKPWRQRAFFSRRRAWQSPRARWAGRAVARSGAIGGLAHCLGNLANHLP